MSAAPFHDDAPAPTTKPVQAALPGLVWEAPPSPERRRGAHRKYQRHADAMRARPGEWLVLRRVNNPRAWTRAQYFRNGDCVYISRELGFEVVARGTTVYGRFVGQALRAVQS